MIGLTPDRAAAEVVRHGVLRLTFADRLTGEVDVLDRMWGPRLRALDLAPDSLYERVRTGVWPEVGGPES